MTIELFNEAVQLFGKPDDVVVVHKNKVASQHGETLRDLTDAERRTANLLIRLCDAGEGCGYDQNRTAIGSAIATGTRCECKMGPNPDRPVVQVWWGGRVCKVMALQLLLEIAPDGAVKMFNEHSRIAK